MKYFRVICNKANDNKTNGNFDVYKIELQDFEAEKFIYELNNKKFIMLNHTLVNTNDVRRVIET